MEGNTTIDADEVLSAAKELGLYEGVLKKSIDPPMLKENLMYALDDTSWISVNTLGCTATICIKEKTKAPLVADKSQPTNVYASYSGQIIEMDVFGGEAKVKVGDAVSAGEMLISGVMKDLQEEIYLTHAYGKIIARTRRTLQVEIPKTENVWQETQTQIYRCSANIFGIDIPLTFREAPKGNYKREHERFPFCIGQIKLPVMVYREKWILIEETEIINEKEDAKNKGKEEMERLFKETSPDAQIEKSSFTFKEEKNRYVYSGVFICREDIAKVSEFIDKLLYFEE